MTREELQAAARQQSWREGWAHLWVLDSGQQTWREAFLATPELASTVWNIGRQRGKTYDAVFIALESGLSIRDGVLRYCAKTKDSAIAIVSPAWNYLVSTMPPELRPVQGRTDYEWVFPSTGCTFVLFGTDAQSFGKGRGPRTHLQFYDEAGFYQELVSVESALMPALQTTGGRALYLSTPAESVGHPYTLRINAARASGRYQHDTFWGNPRVNHEAVIREESSRLGMTREEFLASTYFRREYLAEVVTEEARAAFPAWNEKLAAQVVGDWQRPSHFDAYQAHDAGIDGDPHASLFAYFDPASATVTVENELELRSAAHSLRMWADEVKRLERELYGINSWNGTVAGAPDFVRGLEKVPEWMATLMKAAPPKQPYLRVGDNAQGICRDMTVDHGLGMLPTAKHEKAMEVSNTNHLLATGRIRIHRRCVRLIEQCYTTVWNKTRSAWERTDRNHGDLVDDLVYLTRNIAWHRDCRPKHLDSAQAEVARITGQQPKTWAEAFRRR